MAVSSTPSPVTAPHHPVGLARVTISSPQRRVDVALPDSVPLIELLPELLRHAGDGLADAGERHGGWLLRGPDGTALSTTAGLAAQGVRDGAVLHLVPARAHWPELEYDDVVEAIAAGARRYGLGWSPTATRVTGLAAAGVALGVGLFVAGRADAWPAALGVAAVLVLAGVLASRAYGDAVVGAALAAYGLPFALVAGVSSGFDGAERWLLGSTALLLASLVSAIGVGHLLRLFVAGASAGVLGVLGALSGLLLRPAAAAAIVLSVLVAVVAAVPLLAIRLGKLPMPVIALPADLPAGDRTPEPPPERSRVFAAVARTDEMLTGMLLGIAAVAAYASLVLVRSGDVSGRILVAVAACAFLLRARLFVTVRQRLPLLGAGAAGLVPLVSLSPWPPEVLVVVLGALGIGVVLAGVRSAAQPPSPYVGRAADVIDVLCVISVVPLACAVLGLYGLARGIAG